MDNVRIIVTGCPRSGTLSMKNMLRAAGYDVLHEKMGPQGTVSNFYQFQPKKGYWPPDCKHQGEKYTLRGTTHYVHLVRNPLKCVPSMARIVSRGWREWLGENDVVDPNIKPKLLWSAHAWVALNQLAQQTSESMTFLHSARVRIEKVEEDWYNTHLNPIERPLHQHRGSGNRKSEPLTYADVKVMGSIGVQIKDMAEEYGYDIRRKWR
jgi:hypothetical protein